MTNTPSDTSKPIRQTPIILIGVGLLGILATAALAARIIWEETSLTWRLGPQMIGFSLAHGSAAMLLLSPFVLVLWFLAALIYVIFKIMKGHRFSNITWVTFAAAILTIAALSLPPDLWQRIFIAHFAQSPHAAELVNYAAVQGQTSLAEAFIRHGVPIDSTDHEGNTPAISAARAGDTKLLQFLLLQRANLSATNLDGDSALERAISHHHDAAAALLKSAGATRITGTPEQRERAAQIIVDRDIQRGHLASH